MLGPVIYLIYINHFPTTLGSTTATFADDAAIMTVGESMESSTRNLHSALNKLATWRKQWRIRLNELKSMNNDLASQIIIPQPVYINGTQLSYANTAIIRV